MTYHISGLGNGLGTDEKKAVLKQALACSASGGSMQNGVCVPGFLPSLPSLPSAPIIAGVDNKILFGGGLLLLLLLK